MDTVRMQLGTAVVDVPSEKVDRYLRQGYVVLTDGKRLPYVPVPAAQSEPAKDGCC